VKKRQLSDDANPLTSHHNHALPADDTVGRQLPLESKDVWESKKYPGQYYVLDPANGAPSWIDLANTSGVAVTGEEFKDRKDGKRYRIATAHLANK
jgi:hypothetical protein